MKAKVLPSMFIPRKPDDFIGDASSLARTLHTKATNLAASGSGVMRVLVYGAPGIGKTRLAQMVAGCLTKHRLEIEEINGRDLTIDVVRKWRASAIYNGLTIWGGWTVKLVNELDTATQQAQDLLLSWFDEMPTCTAFIGTSNVNIAAMDVRFQTRLQHWPLKNPTTEEIASFIVRKWKVKPKIAADIAFGSGGNVRAALLDTESHLDTLAA